MFILFMEILQPFPFSFFFINKAAVQLVTQIYARFFLFLARKKNEMWILIVNLKSGESLRENIHPERVKR